MSSALKRLFIFGFSLSLLFSSTAYASDAAWEKYAEAQKKLQVGMYHLLLMRFPEMKPVLGLSKDLQLALVDQKTQRFYYLRKTNPSKIDVSQGLKNFSEFPWEESDEETLQRQNKDYRKLSERIEKLKTETHNNPLWPDLKDKFDSLSRDPEYIEIMVRFKKMDEEAEDLLRSSSNG